LHKRKNRDRFRALALAAGASEPDGFADAFTILLEGTLVHDRDDAVSVVRPSVHALVALHLPTGDQAKGA